MRRWLKSAALAVLIGAAIVQAGVAPARVAAQEQAQAAAVPLKVTVVISRFQGETRKSNLPYTLFVNAVERGERTSLRIGSQVPIPTRVASQGAGTNEPPTTYSYQNVGVSIDCLATPTTDGKYRLSLTINDSSVTAESVVLIATEADPSDGVVTGQHIELRDGAPVRLRPWRIRVTGPDELDAWANEAGLVLGERRADWEGTPYDPHGAGHVSVYRLA